MELRAPSCPVCSASLVLTHAGELDTWVCTSSHGLAMTLSEAHGRLQEDEIGGLWQAARAAVPGPASRPCPICARTMVVVEVALDEDEVAQGEAGDGADHATSWVDVCLEDQLIWFDAGELDEFPLDRPDAPPSDAELAAVERIRAEFGQQLVAAAEASESGRITERIYRRIAARPGLHRALAEVGSLGRA